MARSEINPACRTMRSWKSGFVKIQNLRIIGLILVALMLLACASLPEPETKTPTLGYEPHPDSRLAVLARDLIEESDEGTPGFLKFFRNDDAMH